MKLKQVCGFTVQLSTTRIKRSNVANTVEGLASKYFLQRFKVFYGILKLNMSCSTSLQGEGGLVAILPSTLLLE